MYASNGTFLYNGAATLFSGAHIRCAGPGATLFKNTGGSGTLFQTTVNIQDVVIENRGFDVNGNPASFLTVIGMNGGTAQNIHIRGNRIYDSTILGQTSAQQRQYVLITNCSNCWVENNWLSEGGRIKLGRPGTQLFIRNNVVNKVNDNAITISDLQVAP